jgi:pseudomonalisin
MRPLLRAISLAAAALLAGCAATSVAPSRPAGRLTPINENQTVTLTGNVYPLARPEFDQGPLDPSTPFDRILLVLKPSAAQQFSLDNLVAAQQNPASPHNHQWLTPAEFGAQFGVAPIQIAQITAWLTSHGFTIEEVPAGNRLIAFSGTAGQLQETFHTQMHSYRVATPNHIADHIANAQNPQIPAALASAIGGIVSLNDFRRNSSLALRQLPAAKQQSVQPQAATNPQYSAGSTHYLAPADFANIYDLNPLYNAGSSGAGTSIAIAGRSNINLADVSQFRSTTNLASNPPSVIVDGADPGLAGPSSADNDQAEATLDIEWSAAVAPAAAVTLVAAASTAITDGVDLASAYIVNHATASVLSSSYSNCEQEMGVAELAFYNALWEQAAAEGISVFVSSGDAGAAGCSAGSDVTGSITAVNGLCSSPYATCVGGTEFNEGVNPAQYWAAANSAGLGSALQYIPEEVWNESAANGGSEMWASGGGSSKVYAQPAWQAAVIASVPGAPDAGGMRAVPDVSLTAANHDGVIMVENGGFYIASGTSVAAPSFAGIMALVVASQGGRAQGSANPRLYAIAASAPAAFHPTPSGSNSVPGVPGNSADGAVYNFATGLGSVDAAELVNDWAAQQAPTCPMRLVRARCRSGVRPWLLFR